MNPSPPCWRTDGSFLPDTRTNPLSDPAVGVVGEVFAEEGFLALPVKEARAAGTANGLARSTMAPPVPPSVGVLGATGAPGAPGRLRGDGPRSPMISVMSSRLLLYFRARRTKIKKNAAPATPPTTPPTIARSWGDSDPPLPPSLPLPPSSPLRVVSEGLVG